MNGETNGEPLEDVNRPPRATPWHRRSRAIASRFRGNYCAAMTINAPLELWRETVLPEWIDYNGHMNLAYYVLIFDHATDAFFDSVGLGWHYRDTANCSTFAAETHVTYDGEVTEGAEVRCTTQLLDYDEKRLHYFHRMYHAEEGFLAATTELISLHMDLAIRRVTPMPTEIQANLERVAAAHRGLDKPEQAGRVIGIRSRGAGA